MILKYADLTNYFKNRTPSPIEIYRAVREIRHGKGMLVIANDPDSRSAGSFFKNPIIALAALDRVAAALSIPVESIPRYPAADGQVKLPAAWLLERAGFVKGFTSGRVGISTKHTLAIVNRGGATAAEVFALRDMIQARVRELFGLSLEQEPIQLGD